MVKIRPGGPSWAMHRGLLPLQNGESGVETQKNQGCQNGKRNNPRVFCSIKHEGMFSFRLNNGFQLAENKHGYQSLEITSQNAILSCVT